MGDGLKLAKSTGYTPPISTGKGSVLAPAEYTDKKKASPVLRNAHTKGASLNLGVEVSASTLLALQVMEGDYKAVKDQIPTSWHTSSNGKIYWCVNIPDHTLEVKDGKIHLDGTPVESLLEKLLA